MSDEAFVGRYGSWAVVAGASEGLGAAWAEALAARGLNLVLFARRPEVLDAAAAAIRARHRVDVRTQAFDLAGPGFGTELERLAGSLEVGFGVFNAAHAPRGSFLDLSLEDQLRSVDVNCRGPLTKADVLACAAGATRTPGFLQASPHGEPGTIEPAQVVEEALGKLGRAGAMIPGRFNRFASFLMRRVFSRGTAVGILGNRTRNLTLPPPATRSSR